MYKRQGEGTLAEPKETVHGGDIYRNPSVTDYSVNSNPLGVPEAVRKSVQESADRIMSVSYTHLDVYKRQA